MDSMVGEGFRVTRGELKWDPDVFKRNIPLGNEVRNLIEDICGIWMQGRRTFDKLYSGPGGP